MRGEVCPGQDWFHGWDPNLKVTYQVMDFSADQDRVAIGGSYPNTEKYGAPYKSILAFYTMEVKDMYDYITFDKYFDVNDAQVSLLGVRSIAIQENNAERVIAVLETDMDQSALTILSLSLDLDFYGSSLLQVPFEQAVWSLSNPMLKFRNENQIWLQADSIN